MSQITATARAFSRVTRAAQAGQAIYTRHGLGDLGYIALQEVGERDADQKFKSSWLKLCLQSITQHEGRSKELKSIFKLFAIIP